jgi:hypothetical protein
VTVGLGEGLIDVVGVAVGSGVAEPVGAGVVVVTTTCGRLVAVVASLELYDAPSAEGVSIMRE